MSQIRDEVIAAYKELTGNDAVIKKTQSCIVLQDKSTGEIIYIIDTLCGNFYHNKKYFKPIEVRDYSSKEAIFSRAAAKLRHRYHHFRSHACEINQLIDVEKLEETKTSKERTKMAGVKKADYEKVAKMAYRKCTGCQKIPEGCLYIFEDARLNDDRITFKGRCGPQEFFIFVDKIADNEVCATVNIADREWTVNYTVGEKPEKVKKETTTTNKVEKETTTINKVEKEEVKKVATKSANCKDVYVKRYVIKEEDIDTGIEYLHNATKPTAIIIEQEDGSRYVGGCVNLTKGQFIKIAKGGNFNYEIIDPYEKGGWFDDGMGNVPNLKEDLASGLTMDDIECSYMDRICDMVHDHIEKTTVVAFVLKNKVVETWNLTPEFFDGCYLATRKKA